MSGKPPYFAVLRHSVRMDMVENEDATTRTDETWADRETRPWDPPITDYELPQQVLKSLSSKIPSIHFTAIYSSPFRRCLQTAAVAAIHLDIGQILVHPGLGEVMQRVRKSCPSVENRDSIDKNNNKDYLMTKEECEETVKAASGGRVTIKATFLKGTTVPAWDEAYPESAARLEETLQDLEQQHTKIKQSVLVVTHGDALQAAAQVFLGPFANVYDLDFCSLMAFDANGALIFRHGLKLMKLE